MNTQPHKTQVVIIGGGITGLSAAWYLQQAADLRYVVLEAGQRWGGKVHTEQVDGLGDAPFILETGADAFLTRKPWALELAQALGLAERILPVNSDNSRTFVLHRGRPVPLPDGLQLIAPTSLLPFVRSPLFSPWGKLRAALDLLIPPRRGEDDESLADFMRRRLGAEMLDKVGEPLLGGVYNNDPERQSMQATFPQFPVLEQKYGSLIRGLRAAGRERTPGTHPPFISFQTGTHEIVQALVAQLTGDLRLGAAVHRIERTAGNRWRVIVSDGVALDADAVIVTTPAPAAAHMLEEIAPVAAAHLRGIPYAGIGTAYLAYRREDVPQPLRGLGLVIPGSEGRRIDGVTWTTAKWAGRAPSGYELLRLFFGGPRSRGTLALDDAALLDVLRAEVRSIFGITAPPLFHRVYRWPDAYPQYNLGHLARVSAAESALPPGVYLAGSAYRGVGVPDCVRQGQEAAKQTVLALSEQRSTTGDRHNEHHPI